MKYFVLVLLVSCAFPQKRIRGPVKPEKLICIEHLLKSKKVKTIDDAIKGCDWVQKL